MTIKQFLLVAFCIGAFAVGMQVSKDAFFIAVSIAFADVMKRIFRELEHDEFAENLKQMIESEEEDNDRIN